MMLRILLFEIRKLLEQPIILLFFIACLMLNTIYIATAGLDQSYLNYVQDTETKTGSFITSEFHEKLSNMSSSNQHQAITDRNG
ncbi:hypothetical protein [Alkalicoccobacillus plakortidis]|uniref:ABC transport system permease protein n=1 Tax=Alkalicoccobacillus plakortidis TaxID=444060 RepID=A0ABT0XNB8_9BACI|nr:hypothetical protein [Alkalicoccobacillus plakortidis]MCM2677401.1 hypothetical protein [Alkalicoccobacillus plakortidis]